MWIKLTTVEQVAALQPNTIIIKYPIDGDSVDNFDGANQDNVSVRYIISNNNPAGVISIGFAEDPIPANIAFWAQDLIAFRINKTHTSITEDGIWWVKEIVAK